MKPLVIALLSLVALAAGYRLLFAQTSVVVQMTASYSVATMDSAGNTAFQALPPGVTVSSPPRDSNDFAIRMNLLLRDLNSQAKAGTLTPASFGATLTAHKVIAP